MNFFCISEGYQVEVFSSSTGKREFTAHIYPETKKGLIEAQKECEFFKNKYSINYSSRIRKLSNDTIL